MQKEGSRTERACAGVIFAGALLLSCCHHDSPAMHDAFLVCVARDGKQYDVPFGYEHCREGDDPTRCHMPTGSVIYTRGQTECSRKGGQPLGQREDSN
jgi:hypothetical protein